jgi:uncharacterized protein YqiB (DUF1249 family)
LRFEALDAEEVVRLEALIKAATDAMDRMDEMNLFLGMWFHRPRPRAS